MFFFSRIAGYDRTLADANVPLIPVEILGIYARNKCSYPVSPCAISSLVRYSLLTALVARLS